MTTSTKNSFSALGFSDDDAVIEALRADLADIIRGYIERSQLTQTALERTLGIPQSTISAIKNDRIDRISIEYFIRILTRAGIPWTAKAWKAPHDAAWVAGGIAQLFARETLGQPLNPPSWSVSNVSFHNYSLAGTSNTARQALQTSEESEADA